MRRDLWERYLTEKLTERFGMDDLTEILQVVPYILDELTEDVDDDFGGTHLSFKAPEITKEIKLFREVVNLRQRALNHNSWLEGLDDWTRRHLPEGTDKFMPVPGVPMAPDNAEYFD